MSSSPLARFLTKFLGADWSLIPTAVDGFSQRITVLGRPERVRRTGSRELLPAGSLSTMRPSTMAIGR